MNTTTIVIILVAIVVVSIVIVVASQLRERARIERARRTAALEDHYNRAQRLLAELPGQYLNRNLKLLLLTHTEDICRELRSLGSNLPASKWLQAAQAQKQQVADSQDETQPEIIDSPEKSAQVKELLHNLYKLIESLHASGRLDGESARQNLKYVLFLIHKTHADLHVFQARDHVRQNQLRKAIHCYHLASTEMGKSQDNPLAMKAVKSFRTRIKELEAHLANGGDGPVEQQGKLDKEWDTFLHDDTWKKKADYDD